MLTHDPDGEVQPQFSVRGSPLGGALNAEFFEKTVKQSEKAIQYIDGTEANVSQNCSKIVDPPMQSNEPHRNNFMMGLAGGWLGGTSPRELVQKVISPLIGTMSITAILHKMFCIVNPVIMWNIATYVNDTLKTNAIDYDTYMTNEYCPYMASQHVDTSGYCNSITVNGAFLSNDIFLAPNTSFTSPLPLYVSDTFKPFTIANATLATLWTILTPAPAPAPA